MTKNHSVIVNDCHVDGGMDEHMNYVVAGGVMYGLTFLGGKGFPPPPPKYKY